MTNLERWITCEVDDKGEWKFTNPSPWLKKFAEQLAKEHDLFLEEVLEKWLLVGAAAAYDEHDKKGEVEIIRRELPSRSEKPVVVFGKKGS